jgi:UDP-glucose 4-epimerase
VEASPELSVQGHSLPSWPRSKALLVRSGSAQGRSLSEAVAAIEALLNVKAKVEWRQSRPVDVPASVLAIEQARKVLGWSPATPFEAGLQHTLAWWRSQGPRD